MGGGEEGVFGLLPALSHVWLCVGQKVIRSFRLGAEGLEMYRNIAVTSGPVAGTPWSKQWAGLGLEDPDVLGVPKAWERLPLGHGYIRPRV